MKTLIAAVILAASSLTTATASSIMMVSLDPAFSPTGAITPNSIQDLLARFEITAPNTQDIRVSSLTLGVDVAGTSHVQNLSLFINGDEYGQIIGNPGPTDTFWFAFVLPANFTGILEVKGDLSYGNGTIQTFLDPNNVTALGLTDFSAMQGPDTSLYAPTRQIGSGLDTPEPGTWLMMLSGTALVVLHKLRCRA
jgi:hypothetical protein